MTGKGSDDQDYQRGKLAYDTYCASVGGVAYNGDPLPSFEDDGDGRNRDKIRAAWIAAARAVREEVLKEAPIGYLGV